MDLINRNALSVMGNIIGGYLDGEYDRKETVINLMNFVDPYIINNDTLEFMVTDCYYTIKHLTETGYETTDFELAYFRDCIEGIREYSLDEKNKLLIEYFKSLET